MLLQYAVDARGVLAPFLGDNATAAIGCGFFQAGGFRKYEPAQSCQHVRQARLQETQEFLGRTRIWHGAEMLPTRRNQSNLAIRRAGRSSRNLSVRSRFIATGR